jgi:hypothetical protein
MNNQAGVPLFDLQGQLDNYGTNRRTAVARCVASGGR